MAFHSDPPTSTGTVKWYNGNWPAESKAATVEEARELLDKLYKNGGNTCPVCDKEGLSKNHYTDGCRMNGDAYGRDVKECNSCGWFYSEVWDDY